MKQKILLADDTEELAKAVKAILEYSDYEVDMVFNGKEALDKTKGKVYDCIILDIMMPIMDGIEALKRMREYNIKTPILLLTAKSLIDDKVDGLNSGANDYLTKPFDKRELIARIKALTRIEQENKEKYVIGNITFDKGNSQLLKDKIALNLNEKECELIEIFAKNQDKKISEEELMRRVWIDENQSEKIVPMYVSFLQEKFNALNADIRINNVNGYGLEKIL